MYIAVALHIYVSTFSSLILSILKNTVIILYRRVNTAHLKLRKQEQKQNKSDASKIHINIKNTVGHT